MKTLKESLEAIFTLSWKNVGSCRTRSSRSDTAMAVRKHVVAAAISLRVKTHRLSPFPTIPRQQIRGIRMLSQINTVCRRYSGCAGWIAGGAFVGKLRLLPSLLLSDSAGMYWYKLRVMFPTRAMAISG